MSVLIRPVNVIPRACSQKSRRPADPWMLDGTMRQRAFEQRHGPTRAIMYFLNAREMDKLEVSVVAILVVVMSRQGAIQGPTP